MMAVHELGHIIGCIFSGADIQQVILWPWTISQTIRSGSSAPLIDTWFGPAFGAVFPAIIYIIVRKNWPSWRSTMGFFSGFCLVSNGIYVGIGYFEAVGDAADLLRYGSHKYSLALFGSVAITCGLAIWNIELFRNKTGA
jgi:hypothetical protein